MTSTHTCSRGGARPAGLALFVLATAQLISALDYNIVYVALPEIGQKLGFTSHSLQWVFSAYSVAFGGLLLLGGRAADLFGRRHMFLLGLALYAVSSLLGGFATSPFAIIAARAIQGIGGAFLFPATLSLISTLYAEGPERNRALGIWSLAGSAGLTLGSLVGGTLVGAFGWPSVFFVNVPIAIAVALGAVNSLPPDEPSSNRQGFDLAGAVTSTCGVTLLVFSLAQASEWGWASVMFLTTSVAALVLLAFFVLIEARTPAPLMPLRLLLSGNLATAMALTFMFMATFMALPYFTTELFQRVFGFSPMETGFAFLLPSVVIAAGTQIGGHLANRVGLRPLLLTGLSAGALGAALIAAQITPDGGFGMLVPGFILFGLGQGVAWTPMWIAASAGIDESDQGIASGMASTSLWVGGATGLAVLVLIAGAPDGATVPADALAGSIRAAIFAIALGIALTIPIALLAGRGSTGSTRPIAV